MKYLPVFAIRLRHAFYSDGKCADFALDASESSQRILANHRLIAKARPDGLEVFTPVDSSAQPFIPFRQDMTLSFYLRLQNPDFSLFTDLEGMSGLQAPVYENSGSDPQAGGELSVRAGDAPLAIPLRSSVFAQIRIREITAAWIDNGPVQYTIAFQPRRTRWAFYFVSDELNGGRNGDDGKTPRIVDDDPTRADSPLRFTTSKIGKLGALDDPDDGAPDGGAPDGGAPDGGAPDDGASASPEVGDIVEDGIVGDLAAQYPDHQCFRIVSTDRLACQQAARKRLSLYLGDEKLSSALGNPSPRNFCTLGVQGADDALEHQDSLFRVVKH